LKSSRGTLARLMLYAAKCYWPEVSESELERVADRAAHVTSAVQARDATFLGSLLFEADDLVLCLFHGSSRAAVKRASDQLGIPCERVMDSVWLGQAGPTSPNPIDEHSDRRGTSTERGKHASPPNTTS
jgi:hypothetical protein